MKPVLPRYCKMELVYNNSVKKIPIIAKIKKILESIWSSKSFYIYIHPVTIITVRFFLLWYYSTTIFYGGQHKIINELEEKTPLQRRNY